MAQWGSDLRRIAYKGWGWCKQLDASVNDRQIERYRDSVMPVRQARPRCLDPKAPLLSDKEQR